jgi:hypothetical protein
MSRLTCRALPFGVLQWKCPLFPTQMRSTASKAFRFVLLVMVTIYDECYCDLSSFNDRTYSSEPIPRGFRLRCLDRLSRYMDRHQRNRRFPDQLVSHLNDI